MITIQTTYTNTRAHLAQFLDDVTEGREIVMIRCREGGSVAMIAADELAGLLETPYLLRSPKNAERLLTALGRALKGEERALSLEEHHAEVGFEPEEA